MIQAHQRLNLRGCSLLFSSFKTSVPRTRRRDALMPISMHRALRTTARGLIAALFLLAFGRAEDQALIKVNDYVNFRLGLLLQGQADFQQVANAANNDSAGGMQNYLELGRASCRG